MIIRDSTLIQYRVVRNTLHGIESRQTIPIFMRCKAFIVLKTYSWARLAPTGVEDVVQDVKMSKVDTLFQFSQ